MLSEININDEFNEKLGWDFRDYVILSMRHPPIANPAVQDEVTLELLLPCNIIVYAEDDKITVAAIDTAKMKSVVGNSRLEIAAALVNEKLQRVIANL